MRGSGEGIAVYHRLEVLHQALRLRLISRVPRRVKRAYHVLRLRNLLETSPKMPRI
jgi:hypothetical protein